MEKQEDIKYGHYYAKNGAYKDANNPFNMELHPNEYFNNCNGDITNISFENEFKSYNANVLTFQIPLV